MRNVAAIHKTIGRRCWEKKPFVGYSYFVNSLFAILMITSYPQVDLVFKLRDHKMLISLLSESLLERKNSPNKLDC